MCVSGDFLAGVSLSDDLETGFETVNDLLDDDAGFEVEEPDFFDRIFIQNSFPKLD